MIKIILIPGYTFNRLVAFHGTDSEMAAAELEEKETEKAIADLIGAPGFRAFEFLQPVRVYGGRLDEKYIYFSPSFTSGHNWRLSYGYKNIGAGGHYDIMPGKETAEIIKELSGYLFDSGARGLSLRCLFLEV